MTGLVDENHSAPSAEALFEILIASVAGFDDLGVATAHDGIHAHGVADGRIEGLSVTLSSFS